MHWQAPLLRRAAPESQAMHRLHWQDPPDSGLEMFTIQPLAVSVTVLLVLVKFQAHLVAPNMEPGFYSGPRCSQSRVSSESIPVAAVSPSASIGRCFKFLLVTRRRRRSVVVDKCQWLSSELWWPGAQLAIMQSSHYLFLGDAN
jgi:hypothetical protein